MSDNQEELQTINDIDQFAFAVAAWHQQQVDTLQHMINIPEGSSMKMTSKDDQGNVTEKDVILEGDLLTGFKAGLETALMLLGELPFKVSVVDDEPSKPTDPT